MLLSHDLHPWSHESRQLIDECFSPEPEPQEILLVVSRATRNHRFSMDPTLRLRLSLKRFVSQNEKQNRSTRTPSTYLLSSTHTSTHTQYLLALQHAPATHAYMDSTYLLSSTHTRMHAQYLLALQHAPATVWVLRTETFSTVLEPVTLLHLHHGYLANKQIANFLNS